MALDHAVDLINLEKKGRFSAMLKKKGRLLSKYVARYFYDMWVHLRDTAKVMAAGAEVHYVVGNSTFYSVIVPVERLFRDMLHEAGFEDARILKIRKRNSKQELYEYDVCAHR